MEPTQGTDGLILISIAGFIVGFILAKIKLINYENAPKFATLISIVVAAIVALSSTTTSQGLVAFAGSLAVFALVWVTFGLLFTFGLLLGIEKATKKKEEKVDKQ